MTTFNFFTLIIFVLYCKVYFLTMRVSPFNVLHLSSRTHHFFYEHIRDVSETWLILETNTILNWESLWILFQTPISEAVIMPGSVLSNRTTSSVCYITLCLLCALKQSIAQSRFLRSCAALSNVCLMTIHTHLSNIFRLAGCKLVGRIKGSVHFSIKEGKKKFLKDLWVTFAWLPFL